jgi:hypothetical protein
MGVSRLQVMRRVGDLTKKMKLSVAAFKGKSPGKDWFDGFMKRHQDLSIRKPEKLTTTRARMLNPVVVTNYLNDLRVYPTSTKSALYIAFCTGDIPRGQTRKKTFVYRMQGIFSEKL